MCAVCIAKGSQKKGRDGVAKEEGGREDVVSGQSQQAEPPDRKSSTTTTPPKDASLSTRRHWRCVCVGVGKEGGERSKL